MGILRARRKLAVGVGLLVTFVLAGGTWGLLRTQPGYAQSADPPPPAQYDLTGEALAEELGLELVPQQPSGCADYVVVKSPDVGYCLEGHVRPGVDSWEVGLRLAEIVPTDLERQIFHLAYQRSHLSLPEEQERFEELTHQLTALLEQKNN